MISYKPEDFENIGKIGKGGFGIASKVKQKSDGKIFCLKKVNLTSTQDQHQVSIKFLHSEGPIMFKVNSPFVIHLYSFSLLPNPYAPTTLILLLEYAENKTLQVLIQNHKKNGTKFMEEQIWIILYQLVSGLKDIHDVSVLHRDISPDNIFITADNKFKIGDFGVSKEINTNNPAQTIVGKCVYMAPEIFEKSLYSYPCDYYSLGVTLLAMCYLELNPEKLNALKPSSILSDHPLELHDFPYSTDLKEVIFGLLCRNPSQRFNYKNILSYIFNLERADSLFKNVLLSSFSINSGVLDESKKDNEKLQKIIKYQKDIIDSFLPTKEESLAKVYSSPFQSFDIRDNEISTKAILQETYQFFYIGKELAVGTYRLTFEIDEKCDLYTLWMGVVDSTKQTEIKDDHSETHNPIGGFYSCYTGEMIVPQLQTELKNDSIKQGSIMLELNLEPNSQRTLHIFLNNIQQKYYISNLPSKVKFTISCGFISPIKFKSFEQVKTPLATSIKDQHSISWNRFEETIPSNSPIILQDPILSMKTITNFLELKSSIPSGIDVQDNILHFKSYDRFFCFKPIMQSGGYQIRFSLENIQKTASFGLIDPNTYKPDSEHLQNSPNKVEYCPMLGKVFYGSNSISILSTVIHSTDITLVVNLGNSPETRTLHFLCDQLLIKCYIYNLPNSVQFAVCTPRNSSIKFLSFTKHDTFALKCEGTKIEWKA